MRYGCRGHGHISPRSRKVSPSLLHPLRIFEYRGDFLGSRKGAGPTDATRAPAKLLRDASLAVPGTTTRIGTADRATRAGPRTPLPRNRRAVEASTYGEVEVHLRRRDRTRSTTSPIPTASTPTSIALPFRPVTKVWWYSSVTA